MAKVLGSIPRKATKTSSTQQTKITMTVNKVCLDELQVGDIVKIEKVGKKEISPEKTTCNESSIVSEQRKSTIIAWCSCPFYD